MPSCHHQQAEPVVLSTGETVACVCIECLSPLPADYVSLQIQRILDQVFCEHRDLIEISSLGEGVITSLCAQCSADEFMRELIEAMTRPVESGVIPIVLKVPDELIGKVGRLDLDR